MNNKSLRIVVSILLAAVLFGGLGFLYWKSQSFGLKEQIELRHDLRTLESLDAEWDSDVWRKKDGLSKSYATGESPKEKLLILKSDLSDDFRALQNSSLNRESAALSQLIDKKSELIDSLGAQDMILKNSLKYMPSEVYELEQLIEAQRDLHVKGQDVSLDALSNMSQKLLTEALKFNVSPNVDTKDQVAQFIRYMESVKPIFTEDISDEIDILISHAETIVEQNEQQSSLLTIIMGLHVNLITQKIDALLSVKYDEQLRNQGVFRNILFGYSMLLVMMVVYAGYRVLHSLNAVRVANTSLEKKVDERTKEVTEALGNLKESQVQLVQSEKMAMLGQMVAGVTHEINTPLGYVKNSLDIGCRRIPAIRTLIDEVSSINVLLNKQDASDEEIAAQLEKVHLLAVELSESEMVSELENLMKDGLYGIDQISEIVNGLKNFSRLDRAKIAEFNVHDGLDTTLKIAKNLVKTKVVKKVYREVQPITCSPSSINQVFLNLISNAAQATGEDGEITISTDIKDGFVLVDVEDNGSGIEPDVIGKIFDPFFTTKKIGEGTGLGLSICQRIVKEHGGEIKVRSKVGLGTIFTVALPFKMQELETIA